WGAGPWTRWRSRAALCLLLGMIVFAGTLSAMALGGPRVLGAITPIGGGLLMLGWVSIGADVITRRRQPRVERTWSGRAGSVRRAKIGSPATRARRGISAPAGRRCDSERRVVSAPACSDPRADPRVSKRRLNFSRPPACGEGIGRLARIPGLSCTAGRERAASRRAAEQELRRASGARRD